MKPRGVRAFFNDAKTAFLLGALTGLFVLVGRMIGPGWVIPMLIFGGGVNVGAWLFSDRIAIAAMRARRVTGGSLYDTVQRLSERAGLPMPKVYVSPQMAPNAFATGRSPKKAAVCFTQGALELLTPEEIEGVAAHELAHVKNHDTLISTVAATVAGVLAMIAQWGLFLGVGRREGSNPLLLFGVVILAAVGAALIKAMISRSREYEADADGAKLAGSPRGLMSALQKLDAMSRRAPMQQPNPAMNNLFIVEPLASNLHGGNPLTRLFASHPPTEKRLAALARLEA
ncbi:MAG: M48 family metalloprotease [Phycisphaerales bacterium]